MLWSGRALFQASCDGNNVDCNLREGDAEYLCEAVQRRSLPRQCVSGVPLGLGLMVVVGKHFTFLLIAV